MLSLRTACESIQVNESGAPKSVDEEKQSCCFL